jgi:hypothetical protein
MSSIDATRFSCDCSSLMIPRPVEGLLDTNEIADSCLGITSKLRR